MDINQTTVTSMYTPRHILSNGKKQILCNFDGSWTIGPNDHHLTLVETVTVNAQLNNKKRYNRKPRWKVGTK